MDEQQRKDIVRMAWEIHGVVEDSALRLRATRDDADGWREKQRLLLADMAIHLLQTALGTGPIEIEQLRNNLHAILTLSDAFLPDAGLKAARARLYGEG